MRSPWHRLATWLPVLLLVTSASLAGCQAEGEPSDADGQHSGNPAGDEAATDRRARLSRVENWLYIIDVNLDNETVSEIESSDHDLVVIDLITSERENTEFPLDEIVARLRGTGSRIVLAYLDTGQAEDYRTYWQEGWEIGDPEWLVGDDPDGWEGNYPVAYWYDEWQEIWLEGGGLLDQAIEAGFDGVYLDWVEAYTDENVVAAAEEDDVDPADEMSLWVEAIAERGRSLDPGFLVVGQNATELVALSGRYRSTIDAVAQEQVWFDGGAGNDPPGDCPLPRTKDDVDTDAYVATLADGCRLLWEEYPDSTLHISSEEYLESLETVSEFGIPVFTVDYATQKSNMDFVLAESRRQGFTPFVGRRSLDTYEPPR